MSDTSTATPPTDRVIAHVYGLDYLITIEADSTVEASVACTCDEGVPGDWHWHTVAAASSARALFALLEVRQLEDKATAS